MTTVGYGDRYPVTALGRLIAVGLMLVGIALIGLVTATIATWFVGRLRDVQAAEERTEATLHDVLAELREVRARLSTVVDTPAQATPAAPEAPTVLIVEREGPRHPAGLWERVKRAVRG